MKERHKIIPAGYLMLTKDDTIFMMRRANTGYHDGEYSLIAGHGEDNESLRECVIREAMEETGITVDPSDITLTHVISRVGDGDDRVCIFWTASKWQGELQITEPEYCNDMSWFNRDSLPENMVPEVKQALAQIAQGNLYSELELE